MKVEIEWHSTARKLPPPDRMVLFHIAIGFGKTETGTFRAEFEPVFVGDSGDMWWPSEVSHWAELPEVPT